MQFQAEQDESLREHERFERSFNFTILSHPDYKNLECEGVDISAEGLRFKTGKDITLFKGYTFSASVSNHGIHYEITSIQVRSVNHQKDGVFYGCKIITQSDEGKDSHSKLLYAYDEREKILSSSLESGDEEDVEDQLKALDELINSSQEKVSQDTPELNIAAQAESLFEENTELKKKNIELESRLNHLVKVIDNNNTLLSSIIETEVSQDEMTNEIRLLVTVNRKAIEGN